MMHIQLLASLFLLPLGALSNAVDSRGDSSVSVSYDTQGQLVQLPGQLVDDIARTDAEQFHFSVGLGWGMSLVASVGSESRIGVETGASSVQPPHECIPGKGISTPGALTGSLGPASGSAALGNSSASMSILRRDGTSWGLRVSPLGGPLVLEASYTPQWQETDVAMATRVPVGKGLAVRALAGYRSVPHGEVMGVTIDDSVVWGGGAEKRLGHGLWAIAELDGTVGLNGADSQAQWAAGLRLDHGVWGISMLGGRAMSAGVGESTWNVVASATYHLSLTGGPPPTSWAPTGDETAARSPRETRVASADEKDTNQGRFVAEATEDDANLEIAAAMPRLFSTNDHFVGAAWPGDADPGFLHLDERVFFALNSAELTPAFRAYLDRFAETLLAHPEWRKVRVEGFCDLTGPEWYNDVLSQHRADAVAAYLEERGVPAIRLVPYGFGQTQSQSNDGAESRRVSFTVLDTE